MDEIYGNIAKDKAAILTEVYEIAVQTIVQFDDEERKESVSKLDPRKKSMAIKDIKLVRHAEFVQNLTLRSHV